MSINWDGNPHLPTGAACANWRSIVLQEPVFGRLLGRVEERSVCFLDFLDRPLWILL